MRDLREKVALQPMRGTRKVYILDEAHMMSKSAFNALLKTLEEPPAHVVFVLATTEPERMPPTILSRCQHYRFRRLSVSEIAGKLEGIASREGVNADRRALELIARASDGAMRDGESLLERLLASGEPVLTLSQAEGALGLPPQERIQSLALSLARAESGAMLEALGRLYADGFAPRTVTERVKIALRDVLHVQLGVGGLRADDDPLPEGVLLKLIRTLDEEDARFARSSDLISLEMAFTRALMSAQESGSGAGGADPALAARVTALERSLKDAGARPARSSAPEFDPMARSSRPARPETRAETPTEASGVTETPSGAIPMSSTPSRTVPPRLSGTWGDVVTKSKARLKAFLREGRGSVMDGVVVVEYGPKHKWHAEQVAANLSELHDLVQQVIGPGFDLELVMPDGTKKNSSKRADGLNLAAQPARSDVQPSPTQVNAPPQALEPEPRAVVSNPAVIPISGGLGTMPSGQAGVGVTAVLEEPAVQEMVQEAVLEPLPEMRSPEMNLPETPLPETHRSAAQLRQGGPIPTTELEFERLGQAAPLEPGLFGLQPAPTPTLEDDARNDETIPSAMVNLLETTSGTVDSLMSEPLQAQSDEKDSVLALEIRDSGLLEEPDASTLEVTDAGSFEVMDSNRLEVMDISALDDAPPLEAFDLDELESTDNTPVRTVSAALQGHPTYAVLAKLFSHRVREAGVLEPEAAQAQSTPDKVIPPSEPGGEEGEQA